MDKETTQPSVPTRHKGRGAQSPARRHYRMAGVVLAAFLLLGCGLAGFSSGVAVPTASPGDVPSDDPTAPASPAITLTATAEEPAADPTAAATPVPPETPTDLPAPTPTDTPLPAPTDTPTLIPTDTPTLIPTDTPTLIPTDTPTLIPTDTPTLIPTDTPSAAAGGADSPPVTPTQTVGDPLRIRFVPGGTSGGVTGRLEPGDSHQFVLEALEGQTLIIDTATTVGQVQVLVWGADGTVLQGDASAAPSFRGLLPSTQDYFIGLRPGPGGPATYMMSITIPPP